MRFCLQHGMHAIIRRFIIRQTQHSRYCLLTPSRVLLCFVLLWVFAAAVDFFNEVSLLYGIVADGAAQYERPGEGFPPGFEYLWVPEGVKGKGRKP